MGNIEDSANEELDLEAQNDQLVPRTMCRDAIESAQDGLVITSLLPPSLAICAGLYACASRYLSSQPQEPISSDHASAIIKYGAAASAGLFILAFSIDLMLRRRFPHWL
ncbi:MAG: hypothetical protein ACHQT8_03450 [Chlamydiales bacterium]